MHSCIKNMNTLQKKINTPLLALLAANYYLSILVLAAIAVFTITGREILFTGDMSLYGPLTNNIRLVLAYLVLIDMTLGIYCCVKNKYFEVTVFGVFMIAVIGLLEFYGFINQIPLGSHYPWYFFYIGTSHIIFGLYRMRLTRSVTG